MADDVTSEPAETTAPGEDGATGHPAATAAPDAPTTETPTVASPPPEQPTPTWLTRGRLRRRLRYLRSAREVGLRDLGGLVLDLHRFERERPDLVKAKLDALTELDAERRRLEQALDDRREVDILREPGLASCTACGALLASDARYCSNCGKPTAP
jgi:hypothetical protein